MNSIILSQNQTMSSLEMAELTGKRHGNVVRTIESLIKSGVIQQTQIEKVENKQSLSPNKFTSSYIFSGEQGKRDSIIVVAQLSPEFTANIVDRWQYLEKKELNKQLKKATRQESKDEYKPMAKAIESDHDDPKSHHFSNEANMLNRIIIGMTASKYRVENDISSGESIRDYMTPNELEAYNTLQRANTVYIEDGIEYQERKAKLTALFNRKHKDLLIEEVHLINA